MAALRSRCGHHIFVLWFHLSSSIFVFPRIVSAVADWMSTILRTWCGLSTNLECRSEMYCTRHAEYTGRKNRHLGTIAQLCRAIYSQLRHMLRIGKKTCSTAVPPPQCPRHMANFGPVAAEICRRVWGTPTHFNGFRFLAALLHGTLVVDASQTMRRWTEGATYIR